MQGKEVASVESVKTSNTYIVTYQFLAVRPRTTVWLHLRSFNSPSSRYCVLGQGALRQLSLLCGFEQAV